MAARTDALSAHQMPAWMGIASMCAGVFCLTVNDALAKWLGQFYPTVEIVFFRMLVALPLIAAVGLSRGGPRVFRTTRLPAHLLRGLFAASATWCFFLSLRLLPLAEATAIAFTAPIIVTALSYPLLRERVGGLKWLATGAGFVGVLVIVRPGTAAFGLAALVPLGTALFYALLMLSARMLGNRENIWATMFYMTLVPLAVTAAVVPWSWQTPALAHLPALAGVGLFGGAALTLITQGFRIGPAALVAPFDYTGLVWATAFGWLIWGEIPSGWSLLGAAIIAGSGIYLAYRHVRDAPGIRPASSTSAARTE